MSLDNDSHEMGTAIFNGLRCEFEKIISALDALEEETYLLTLETVNGRLLLDEQERSFGM